MSTRDARLIGLSAPEADEEPRSHSRAAELLFEARLNCSLTRIRRGKIRPAWKPAPPAGVIADKILGSAVDGTLVGVALLDEKLWRRLFWLQILCKWDKEISPHSQQFPSYGAADEDVLNTHERALPAGLGYAVDGDSSRREVILRTYNSRLADKHIDGDVLARILRHNGAATLDRVIRDAADRNDRVGLWVRTHLDEELGAVDEIIDILRGLLDCWL